MTKAFRAVLALLLLTTAFAAGSVSAQPSGPLPPLTGHVRLMVAGDSTAAGYPILCGDGTPFGERQVLGDWLTRDAGLDVQFVGSQASSCAQPYHRHEGHSAWTIGMLADNIAGFLSAHPAEILVLRIGVNDATSWSNWRSAEQMAVDYQRLIANARAQIPTIRILAGEIIPPDGSVQTAYPRDLARAGVTARRFNAMLPTIIAPYGDAVHVGEFGRITPARLADGLHPNPYGYVDIAWIMMQQPDGLWPWLSADPPPATKPWDVVLDPWRSHG